MPAQHQGVSSERDAPAPEPDLTCVEPVAPGDNCRERDDRGPCRERFPGGSQKPPSLLVYRYRAGERHDRPSRKEDERGHVAIADQMDQRPEADPGQERMTGDPDDA